MGQTDDPGESARDDQSIAHDACSAPARTSSHQAGRSDLASALLIMGLASCVLVLSFTTGVASTNPMSRFATIDSLVHDHAFIINRSVFLDTADKVQIDGRYYSSKPPLLSTVGAVVYRALHQVTGLSFREDKLLAVKVINMLFGAIPHALLLFYAYLFLTKLNVSGRVVLWSFVCFAFGRLGLAYSTTLNNHTVAELAGFVAFYHAWGLRRGHLSGGWHWIAAGMAAGLAPPLDLGMMFLSCAIGVYLLSWDWRRTLTRFAPASLPPLVAHFALTWMISGGWRPIYLRRELYEYPGSYWLAPTGMDALDEPRLTYLFNMLLGHHGVLSMTPVLAFALWAIGRAVIKRSGCQAEAIAIGSAFAVMVTFYTITTKNYGGFCVGFRWLMPMTPLLLAFLPLWMSRNRSRLAWMVFVACALVSQFHAFDGLHDPWLPSQWDRWLTG